MVSGRLRNHSSFISRNNILCILILLLISCIFFQYYEVFSTQQENTLINDVTIQTESLSYFNKTDYNSISLYYHHATSARNSSYPYISGDTFRAFSDYVYDETKQDDLSLVKYGEVVFVKTDMLSKFFSSPFNSIQNPFVLLTHNSDYSAPGKYGAQLSNPKILHWYASNPNERNRPKLSPIPIGLANRRWTGGNLDKIMYAFKTHRKSWLQRTNLLYVNFDVSTNKKQRTDAFSQASTIENVQIIKERISFENYLEQIGNVKFVLSPPGNGFDCHRTWEALLMGAVPIVLNSELDPLFLNTRTIIINSWSKLTQSFLLSFNFSSNDHLLPDVLYAQYWRDKIFTYQ